LGLCLMQTGCVAPIGADRTTPEFVYRQTHDNAVSRTRPSRETQSALHRFDQAERFAKAPDAALQLIHQKAVESGERGLLFALSELNYLAGERLCRSVKPWEARDTRDYYLASAVYAWFFLFGDASEPPPGVKGHSIIAVKGNGDFHKGRDGLVGYESAHVNYVESEFIVRGPHSCQGLPSTIEEVRRILHEHLSSLPADE
jgi:hypothetical protein